MARHRSRSASASDARWWLIVPAASSNPRAELDSSAEPYAIRQWCFRLPPMCPAPSARFNATDDAARISWSATGFSGPRTVVANSIATSAARCPIACAASFGDGVVMCSMVTSVVFMPIPQTVESNRGKGRPAIHHALAPIGFDGYFPFENTTEVTMGHIRDRFGVGSRSSATATVSATDRTAPENQGQRQRQVQRQPAARDPVRPPESGHGHGHRLRSRSRTKKSLGTVIPSGSGSR
jgi:hypothetical protein